MANTKQRTIISLLLLLWYITNVSSMKNLLCNLCSKAKSRTTSSINTGKEITYSLDSTTIDTDESDTDDTLTPEKQSKKEPKSHSIGESTGIKYSIPIFPKIHTLKTIDYVYSNVVPKFKNKNYLARLNFSFAFIIPYLDFQDYLNLMFSGKSILRRFSGIPELRNTNWYTLAWDLLHLYLPRSDNTKNCTHHNIPETALISVVKFLFKRYELDFDRLHLYSDVTHSNCTTYRIILQNMQAQIPPVHFFRLMKVTDLDFFFRCDRVNIPVGKSSWYVPSYIAISCHQDKDQNIHFFVEGGKGSPDDIEFSAQIFLFSSIDPIN